MESSNMGSVCSHLIVRSIEYTALQSKYYGRMLGIPTGWGENYISSGAHISYSITDSYASRASHRSSYR